MARARAKQPAAITEITVKLIPGNLNVLAEFRTHLPSKMGSRLQINRTTGQFSRVSGLKAALRRTDDDSLTNAVNFNLVEQMFVSAISLISKNESNKNNILTYELRKKIFDGLSAYHELAYHEYRNRENDDAIIQSFDIVRNLLKSGIGSDHFTYWNSEPKPSNRLRRSQDHFSEDAGEGICFVFCTDWCLSCVIKGKDSFDKSKTRLPGTRNEQICWLEDRLTKKGSHLHFSQIAQNYIKMRGFVSEGIKLLEDEKKRLENPKVNYFENNEFRAVLNGNVNRIQLTAVQKSRLKEITFAIDHFRKVQGTDFDEKSVFQAAIKKYRNLKSVSMDRIKLESSLNRVGYLCDRTDFKKLIEKILTPVLIDSANHFDRFHRSELNDRNPISEITASIISRRSQPYLNLKRDIVHTTAFHYSHEFGYIHFRVFAQNHGEFKCHDIFETIFAFSQVYSLTSIFHCINEISIEKFCA